MLIKQPCEYVVSWQGDQYNDHGKQWMFRDASEKDHMARRLLDKYKLLSFYAVVAMSYVCEDP